MLTYFAFKLVRILQNSASVCRCSNIVLNGTHRLHLLEHAPQEHLIKYSFNYFNDLHLRVSYYFSSPI